jgi:hypothetical protein
MAIALENALYSLAVRDLRDIVNSEFGAMKHSLGVNVVVASGGGERSGGGVASKGTSRFAF